MADVKISGLPASTVPLAGTEVLPIVQGGATKQVSIANLTAGRDASALSLTATNLTASTAVVADANKKLVSLVQPAAAAYLSTNQSVTTFTPTKIAYDTELFDTNSNFASGTFTPTVAGYYQVSIGLSAFADSTTFSRCFVSAYKNGAEYARFQDIATIGQFITFINLSGSCLIYCNGTTDTIEGYGFAVGTNPGFAGGASQTYIQAVLVRGA
jgi:hypothetical protein